MSMGTEKKSESAMGIKFMPFDNQLDPQVIEQARTQSQRAKAFLLVFVQIWHVLNVNRFSIVKV